MNCSLIVINFLLAIGVAVDDNSVFNIVAVNIDFIVFTVVGDNIAIFAAVVVSVVVGDNVAVVVNVVSVVCSNRILVIICCCILCQRDTRETDHLSEGVSKT